MMLWRAKQAIKSTSPSQLTRMAKSEDFYVRTMVAENPYTPANVLRTLARDEDSAVRGGVAKNPSTSTDVLISMVKESENSFGTILVDIAQRTDLSKDVLTAFSEISVPNAAHFADRLASPVKNGYFPPQISQQVLFILASIKDTRKPLLFSNDYLTLEWLHPPCIQRSVAELGGHVLDEQTMLVLAQIGDVATHRTLVATVGTSLPREAAVVLSGSEDIEVLNGLLNATNLNQEERALIRERLATQPEWLAQEVERMRTLERAKIVDRSSGKVIQEAALASRVFDSPVEEVFWDAYRKSLPMALSGLVAQHGVGRLRLDFAIPDMKIGIEVDGFRFHSSQEDIVKDRQRQRELEQLGWRIVRFAAMEVFDDANKCVRQAARWVDSI